MAIAALYEWRFFADAVETLMSSRLLRNRNPKDWASPSSEEQAAELLRCCCNPLADPVWAQETKGLGNSQMKIQWGIPMEKLRELLGLPASHFQMHQAIRKGLPVTLIAELANKLGVVVY